MRLRFAVDLWGCHRPARGAGIGGVCLEHFCMTTSPESISAGRLAEGFAGSVACWAPGWSRPARMTRKPRPLISTPNWWTGWSRSPTVVSVPALGLSRPTRWQPIGLRWAVLPPLAATVGTTTMTRLGRDYYVSVGGNAYSVHPTASRGDAVAGRPFAALGV